MSSHPATKQDLWVLHKDVVRQGTFCEVGAYDGVTHSNTKYLEELGWRGVLIEAHYPYYEKCRENRPKARCVNEAITGSRGPNTLYIGGEWTGLKEYMSLINYSEHIKRKNPTVKVQTKLLSDIICDVDYLSLDTEGGELETLMRWLQAGCRCKLLTVEFNYDQEKFERLVHLCNEYDMVLDEVRGFDLCFVSKQ